MLFLKVPNRIYLFAIALALLVTGYGFQSERQESTDWISIGLNILIVTGTFFLLKNGSFFQSRYFRLVWLAFALIILGFLFKVMHWPFSGPLLIIGMLIIPVIYLIHYYHKPEKEALDLLKLIWVLSFFILKLLLMFHWVRDDYNMVLINGILFFLIIVLVFYEERKDPEWINS
jgi:hypothetical protein